MVDSLSLFLWHVYFFLTILWNYEKWRKKTNKNKDYEDTSNTEDEEHSSGPPKFENADSPACPTHGIDLKFYSKIPLELELRAEEIREF